MNCQFSLAFETNTVALQTTDVDPEKTARYSTIVLLFINTDI